MKSKFILAFLILAFVVLSGCTYSQTSGGGSAGGEVAQQVTNQPPPDELEVGEFTIERTNNGYAPSPLTIKKGSTVFFVNNSSGKARPASAIHPSHTVYPGTDISKCGGTNSGNIFDACRGLNPGEMFSFTFNEVGEWGYHDHLNSSKRGKIIVVE